MIGEMSLSIKAHINSFKNDDAGTTAIEFCLLLPLFAALAFFVLDMSKAQLTALHGASEARTAAWMSARLEVEIDGNYRALPKETAGIKLFRPFCDNGADSLSSQHLEDKLPNEDYIAQLQTESRIDDNGDQMFVEITDDVGEKFFRTECIVNDFAYSNRGAKRFEFFKIQEKALVPNVKTFRFDESNTIACGYDRVLLDGLDQDGFDGEMDALFPNLFPRASSGGC